MLLAIDIGNTFTALGVYEERDLREHWQISTVEGQTADELALKVIGLFQLAGLRAEDIDAAILASVVPPLTDDFIAMVSRTFQVRCLVVGPGLKTGMPIKYEDPREVGADRIVNAIAARDRHPDTGLLLVDFGTATIFDVVSPEGAYLGGAICPGIGISSEALFRHAARLPRVDLTRPEQVVGRNTVASMRSGLIYGYVSLVDGLGRRMMEEVGFSCRVIATGRAADPIAELSDLIDEVDEHLTLHGLMLLHRRNRRSRGG